MNYDVRDLSLADRGHQRITWAARHMPVLSQVQTEFAAEQPFSGRRIAASLHITTETAVLLHALHAGGAEIALCASNPLSTRDDVCAALAADKLLRFSVVVVNDTPTKRFFDNRYGTGQNTIDGILRATNTLLAGATFVVAGYGWCGRGIAMRARGMGARVIVCEVSAIKALEAVMDGLQVLPMAEAAPLGDIFVTATGMAGVICSEHFMLMKDGAILANSGHFDVEVDVAALRDLAVSEREAREHVTEFQLSNGKALYLLAEGRLVGQAAAEASPAAIMDLSFADQALSTRYLFQAGQSLPAGVYDVPQEIDERVAKLKLQSMGVRLDTLNDSQFAYQNAWQLGTA